MPGVEILGECERAPAETSRLLRLTRFTTTTGQRHALFTQAIHEVRRFSQRIALWGSDDEECRLR